MGKEQRLGEFEELIVLAILYIGENAYGVTIQEALEDVAHRDASLGAIYTTLERLEAKGFLTSWEGSPTAERGGRAKRFYQVTGVGKTVLHAQEHSRLRLRPQLGRSFVRGGA